MSRTGHIRWQVGMGPASVFMLSCLCVGGELDATVHREVLPESAMNTARNLSGSSWLSRHMLSEVVSCPASEQSTNSVCLELRFRNSFEGWEGIFSCTVFEGDVTSAPVFPQDFSHARIEVCTAGSRRTCRVLVQNLEPARTYHAFCAEFADPPVVLPPCDVRLGPGASCGVQTRTTPGSISAGHQQFGVTSLAGAGLVMIYMVWSFRFDHVRGVHETAVAVLAGLVLGLIVYRVFGATPDFDYDMFSYYVLPMVIFNAGFTLDKVQFCWYADKILSLGVVGTILMFLLLYLESRVVNAFTGPFQTFGGDVITLSVHERLVMASVLSSSDTVAPLAFLPPDSFPRMFSIVFGEGVLNDVVAILLSTSVAESTALPSMAELSEKIVYYFLTSALMGVGFGCMIAYTFKHGTWLHEEVVHPCALMILLNYVCYVLAEMLDISSICALFVCALVCGHYASASLSKDAQRFADQIAEFFAYCAEAFVFGYFGFTAVRYLIEPAYFSISLITFYMLSICVSRFLTVFFVGAVLRAFNMHHMSLGLKELTVISLAGCMRGTICYALILRSMPPSGEQSAQQMLLVSTVLGIVLVNCLLFGGIFPSAIRMIHVLRPRQTASRDIFPHHYRVRTWLHTRWAALDDAYFKPALQRPLNADDDDGFGDISDAGDVTTRSSVSNR